ncbi:MAG: hypothetical protein MK134_13085, partial [Dehalococcoidia bacterium]|nr:hypothetical protein [Dehalococcoidia bacterium]
MPVNAIDKITQGQSKSRHYITFQLVLAKSPADRHRGKTTYVEKPPKIFLKKIFLGRYWGSWASVSCELIRGWWDVYWIARRPPQSVIFYR